MIKKFTLPQKEMLEKKVLNHQIAENQMIEFIDFLRKEHQVDESWQVLSDLSGFEKIEQAVEKKKE